MGTDSKSRTPQSATNKRTQNSELKALLQRGRAALDLSQAKVQENSEWASLGCEASPLTFESEEALTGFLIHHTTQETRGIAYLNFNGSILEIDMATAQIPDIIEAYHKA